MFAYCRNNPVKRVDVTGLVDADCYSNDPHDQEDLLDTGEGGGGSLWDIFTSTLDSLANGLDMAQGNRSYNGPQKHHIIPYNNKKYSEEYQAILKEYHFSLTGKQNLVELEAHRGRHTEGYHYFIKGSVIAIDTYAQGDMAAFERAFTYLKCYVGDNQWLLYAQKKGG